MEGRSTDRGRKDTLFPSAGVRLSGCFAWLFWSLVHVFFLIGFRSKADVLLTQDRLTITKLSLATHGRSIDMDQIRKLAPAIIGQHLDVSI